MFTKEELEELLGLMYSGEFDSDGNYYAPGCRWVAIKNRIKKELEKLKGRDEYEYKLLNIKIGHPDFGLVEPFTDLITAMSYVQRSYENAKYEMLKSFRAILVYSSKDGKNIALIFRHLTGGHVVKYNENDRVLLKQILESHVKRTHRSYKRRTGEM